MLRKDQIIIAEDYLKFIRSQRCLACGREGVDPDHLIARGTREHKRNDLTAAPICRVQHTERGQLTDTEFEYKHKVNLWKEVAFLLMEYWIVPQGLKDSKGAIILTGLKQKED